ncbi:MAG: serine protease, partial [Flavobacteriales bacterium CG11_big_fil_rev_8_21_14_0_20_35_7]
MKKISTLFLISAFSGILTLGGYKLFFEKNKQVQDPMLTSSQSNLTSRLVNYAIPAENTDFTVAADATLAAVVHVKNVSVQEVQDPFS